MFFRLFVHFWCAFIGMGEFHWDLLRSVGNPNLLRVPIPSYVLVNTVPTPCRILAVTVPYQVTEIVFLDFHTTTDRERTITTEAVPGRATTPTASCLLSLVGPNFVLERAAAANRTKEASQIRVLAKESLETAALFGSKAAGAGALQGFRVHEFKLARLRS